MAVRSLLREHQRIVFKVAGVYAHDAPDRDDLAQDIAAQLWRSFRSFDPSRAKFSTWLYRIALNVAISHARMQQRSAAGRSGLLDDAGFEAIADPGVMQLAPKRRSTRSRASSGCNRSGTSRPIARMARSYTALRRSGPARSAVFCC